MIAVPQLGGDKDLFAGNSAGGKAGLQRFAYLTLIPISFRTIEVSKASFQRVSGRTYRRGCIRNQRAKAENGDLARTMTERHSFGPKLRRVHDAIVSTARSIELVSDGLP